VIKRVEPTKEDQMKNACPFSGDCRNGDLLEVLCQTTKPCSEFHNDCHIYIAKIARSEAKKSPTTKAPEPSENIS
jgi:hypothetical protein